MPFPYKPKAIQSTGDDSPAISLKRFVWRMTGVHQLYLCAFSVVVAALHLAPIEIQRRIIDTTVNGGPIPALLQLGAIYGGVILTYQIFKFGVRTYQAWLGESTTIYLRTHLLSLTDRKNENGETHTPGSTISVTTSEVEKLGGFAGTQISEAVANLALLVGGATYMLIVAPKIAMFSLVFLIPQVALTPFIQKRINALLEERVTLVRTLSEEIETGQFEDSKNGLLANIYRNRITIQLIKFALKVLLNLLNALAPISVLVFGGIMVVRGNADVGVIVAFLSGFERMAGPARDLLAFYRQAEQARVQHDLIGDWITFSSRKYEPD